MTREIYLDQKLGENRSKRYRTILTIVGVYDHPKTIRVKDKDGTWYTYFKNDRDGDWHKYLQVGVMLPAYVIQKPNPNDDDKPYKNIYPDHFLPKPINPLN